MLVFIFSVIFLFLGCVNCGQDSFYSFKVKDTQGNEVDLADYSNKVTLVVNAASQCGHTESHYKALKRLHDILSFGDKFSVLAFPSNDFGEQEPWEDAEILEFVRGHFKAEFPVFAKRNVIGSEASPEWKWLAEKSVAPKWNFQKYLINQNGQVVKSWDAKTSVESIFEAVKSVIDGVDLPEKDKHVPSSTSRDDTVSREEKEERDEL